MGGSLLPEPAHLRIRGQSGHGCYAFAYGCWYTGQRGDGHIHSHGRMEWLDGSSYDCQFVTDPMGGEGSLVCPDSRTYRGQWRDGTMHGRGVGTDAAGAEVASEWRNGERVPSASVWGGAEIRQGWRGGTWLTQR